MNEMKDAHNLRISVVNKDSNQWHEGELKLQRLHNFGHGDKLRRVIKRTMPEVAQEFLRTPKMVAATILNGDRKPVLSVFESEDGAISADTEAFRIKTNQFDIAVREQLAGSSFLGLIAVDFEARKRMRVNGRISNVDDFVSVDYQEVYANCPKYIQLYQPNAPGAQSTSVRQLSLNDSRWRAVIESTQTTFIGTCHPEVGCDASHRGGKPGFLKIDNQNRILLPDYLGNFMYQTLGNIAIEPAVSLVALDVENNQAIRIAAKAEIKLDLTDDQKTEIPGAQALVVMTPEKIELIHDLFRRNWSLAESSPFNP